MMDETRKEEIRKEATLHAHLDVLDLIDDLDAAEQRAAEETARAEKWKQLAEKNEAEYGELYKRAAEAEGQARVARDMIFNILEGLPERKMQDRRIHPAAKWHTVRTNTDRRIG